MKIGIINEQDILNKAAQALNTEENPFTAEVVNGRLVVSWRWKDAVTFGFGTVTKDVQDFRYVVVLGENHTFYGYDSRDSLIMDADIRGSAGVQMSSFTGHEVRLRKEIAIGKNKGEKNAGIREWNFSTKRIHEPVRQFFEENGWRYKEPSVTWVETSNKKLYKCLGLLFGSIGLILSLVFFLEGVIPMLCMGAVFLLAAVWTFLVGLGKAKLPVFSMKAILIFMAAFFAGVYGLIFLVLFIYLKVMGG